ncbi:MAG: pantoate--beta-alanine ligase, partial [Gammaproteobacteria bacterium]|nr:pantoate--beta-alanine ligase [Gammaproteobacteria bacterium]MDH5691874.1 pantoate--beta-alanine ligase [Gammaproteobacteria bacterium]
MITAKSLSEIHSWIGRWKASNQRVAFVPTMGNLHDGHIALVERAKRLADKVVVSIYVNPTQFGQNEDFDKYPRTLEEDQQKLIAAEVDLLFLPDVNLMYPLGPENSVKVEVPHISQQLCGVSRPNHFAGVATVVNKFFNIIRPDIAVFGEKDYQQLFVIRRMVQDLYIPVQIEGAPTIREESGLARSSRNNYLDETQRLQAAQLYQTLKQAKENILQGERNWQTISEQGKAQLDAKGWECEYFELRSQHNLSLPADASEKDLVLLVAARLGDVRLIDNIAFSLQD